jgi:hypothetical protein
MIGVGQSRREKRRALLGVSRAVTAVATLNSLARASFSESQALI